MPHENSKLMYSKADIILNQLLRQTNNVRKWAKPLTTSTLYRLQE